MQRLSTLSIALLMLVWLLLIATLGYVFQHFFPALAVAALLALAWMFWRLPTRSGQSLSVPDKNSTGVLPETAAARQRTRRLVWQLRALRNAGSALPDAVILLDKQGRLLWFNPAAAQLFGLRWPRDRMLKISESLADHPIGAWLKQDSAAILADVPAPGDANLRLSINRIPLGEQQFLLLGRDITAITRLEQIRRDFIANVSHELRTPLTVIHGYLDLIDPEDSPTLAPILDDLRAQSQRMTRIVEDLLILSRLETQMDLSEERIVIPALLSTLIREAEALSRGRHIVRLENTLQADLYGSLKDIHSAFSNLVSNAVRYTPSGGSITLGWRGLDNGGAVFEVIDTGYGIPQSHIQRLTERFYRVSSSRSRETGGTGLGLSIVKHALNQHQAQIVIDSEPGRGSTFTAVFGSERILKPVLTSASPST